MLLLTLSEGGWYWCCYLLLVRVARIGVVTYSYRGWLVLVLLLTLSEGGWYWCCYLLLARVARIGVVTYS